MDFIAPLWLPKNSNKLDCQKFTKTIIVDELLCKTIFSKVSLNGLKASSLKALSQLKVSIWNNSIFESSEALIGLNFKRLFLAIIRKGYVELIDFKRWIHCIQYHAKPIWIADLDRCKSAITTQIRASQIMHSKLKVVNSNRATLSSNKVGHHFGGQSGAA